MEVIIAFALLVLAAILIPKNSTGLYIASGLALLVALGAASLAPKRFAGGLVLGWVAGVGLDMAYFNWVGLQTQVASVGWMALFWPDWMFRTVAIEDWGWGADSLITRCLGYAAAGSCYGLVIGVVHALKSPRPKLDRRGAVPTFKAPSANASQAPSGDCCTPEADDLIEGKRGRDDERVTESGVLDEATMAIMGADALYQEARKRDDVDDAEPDVFARTEVWNSEDAIRLYKAAAAKGHVEATAKLAQKYILAQRVDFPENPMEAAKWVKKAAERNFLPAQTHLGVYYLCGQGVLQDNQKAIEWFSRAAERGDAEAQYYLGMVFANGKDKGNLHESVNKYKGMGFWQIYKQASEGKSPDKLLELLGERHALEGVVTDMIAAHKWMSLAALQNHFQYGELAKSIESLMTEEQLAQSKRDAEELLERLQQ